MQIHFIKTAADRVAFSYQDSECHVVDQLDWHNNPPSMFFAAWDRENYARSWLKRLSLCGLLGDRQNYLRILKAAS